MLYKILSTNFVAYEGDHKYEGSSKESTWRIAMHFERHYL